jgi:hypothetical protein
MRQGMKLRSSGGYVGQQRCVCSMRQNKTPQTTGGRVGGQSVVSSDAADDLTAQIRTEEIVSFCVGSPGNR